MGTSQRGQVRATPSKTCQSDILPATSSGEPAPPTQPPVTAAPTPSLPCHSPLRPFGALRAAPLLSTRPRLPHPEEESSQQSLLPRLLPQPQPGMGPASSSPRLALPSPRVLLPWPHMSPSDTLCSLSPLHGDFAAGAGDRGVWGLCGLFLFFFLPNSLLGLQPRSVPGT